MRTRTYKDMRKDKDKDQEKDKVEARDKKKEKEGKEKSRTPGNRGFSSQAAPGSHLPDCCRLWLKLQALEPTYVFAFLSLMFQFLSELNKH